MKSIKGFSLFRNDFLIWIPIKSYSLYHPIRNNQQNESNKTNLRLQGFDTRDTEYSGPRLTWEKIAWNMQMGNRVVLSNTTTIRKNRLKRSWADELLNTFGQVACYETAIPGSKSFLSSKLK